MMKIKGERKMSVLKGVSVLTAGKFYFRLQVKMLFKKEKCFNKFKRLRKQKLHNILETSTTQAPHFQVNTNLKVPEMTLSINEQMRQRKSSDFPSYDKRHSVN